jgi:large conductance mechanosensitive channel
MLKAMRDSISRSELITLALGLTLALAAWTLIEEAVANLIAPLISVFIGQTPFEANSFTINGSEFGYGQVIEAAITFLLVAALVVIVYQRSRGRAAAGKTRECPECTSAIPVAAKRCPACTAVIQPGVA